MAAEVIIWCQSAIDVIMTACHDLDCRRRGWSCGGTVCCIARSAADLQQAPAWVHAGLPSATSQTQQSRAGQPAGHMRSNAHPPAPKRILRLREWRRCIPSQPAVQQRHCLLPLIQCSSSGASGASFSSSQTSLPGLLWIQLDGQWQSSSQALGRLQQVTGAASMAAVRQGSPE